MSISTPKNVNDPEIDLSTISRGIGNAFQQFSRFIFNCIQFIIRNIIVLTILLILGVVAGYFLDKEKSYDHQVIVMPNFGSTDYLYSKVNLLKSKIRERDTSFLESLGIEDPQDLIGIKIKPVIDVYNFVNANELNYKILELMADDSDFSQVVIEETTSKNYTYHAIFYSTRGKTTPEKTLAGLMNFFNNSDHFAKIQVEHVNNVRMKMNTNDTLIKQIDAILNGYAKSASPASAGGNSVYYNENSQLNDVIRTKDELIEEQGRHRVDLVNIDKIVKLNSSILNMQNTKGLNGKMKFILPLVLISIFIVFRLFRAFYKHQSQRLIHEKGN